MTYVSCSVSCCCCIWNMTSRTKTTKRKRAEDEIDALVIAQADDDSAWEKPVQVKMDRAASLSIPAGLAARAAFLAKLHREKGLEEWLTSKDEG